MRPTRHLLLLACACLLDAWAAPVLAGTAQASFPVRITLGSPLVANGGSFCTSQTASQATNAQVTVVCATDQFVSIQPWAGSPFLGTSGGAYRFMLTPGTSVSTDGPLWHAGAGTVTTVQIHHNKNQEEVMEILVSF